jgi:nucleotide-binding universal stress UspA family protein
MLGPAEDCRPTSSFRVHDRAKETEMYRRVVVPLDGSALAEEVLPQAIDLARLSDAPIHLLRVVDFTRSDFGPYAIEYASTEPVLAEERTTADDYLGEVEARVRGAGLAVDSEVRQGRVARELVAAVKPGDIIAMASHGRGGLSRWLLGSVAEDVLRHAAVPILLVKSAGTSAGKAGTTPATASAS